MSKNFKYYQDNLIRENEKINWEKSINNNCSIFYKCTSDNLIYCISLLKKYDDDRHKIYISYNGESFLISKSALLNGHVNSIIKRNETINKNKLDNYYNNDLYCVYCHVNNLNGKKYIGITSTSPTRRWGNNGTHYNGQVFGRAIKKYGWDNFTHIILIDNLEKDVAELVEIELIKKYNTTNPKYGYNVSTGGQVFRHMTDFEKENLRKKFTGRKLTKEWNEKIRKAQTGLKRTNETKEKIRNAVSVKVICLTNLKIYKSLTQASKLTNASIGHISSCCNKKRLSAGTDFNGNKLYWMFYDEYIDNGYDKLTKDEIISIHNQRLNIANKKHMPIRNKITNIKYDSIPLASKKTGVGIDKIRNDLLFNCKEWEYVTNCEGGDLCA